LETLMKSATTRVKSLVRMFFSKAGSDSTRPAKNLRPSGLQVELLESRIQPSFLTGGLDLGTDLGDDPLNDGHHHNDHLAALASALATPLSPTSASGGVSVASNGGGAISPATQGSGSHVASQMAAEVNALSAAARNLGLGSGVSSYSQHAATPVLRPAPLANVQFTTQLTNVSSLATSVQLAPVQITTGQSGIRPLTSSSPNFSSYVGVTSDNRLNGISLAIDPNTGATILASAGVVMTTSGKAIEVATSSLDGTTGGNASISLPGSDLTGVGVSSDPAGNLFISATLASVGGTGTGLLLVEIDPFGNVNAVQLTNTAGTAGYLRFDANTGLVFFTGSVDVSPDGLPDTVVGTIDPNNWTPAGTTAATIGFTFGGSHVASASHSVVLDSAGNAFYATTVTDPTGNNLPGLIELDPTLTSVTVIGFFTSVGPNGNAYDVVDGNNAGHETIYFSGTFVPTAGSPNALIVASFDDVTMGPLVGAGLGAAGAGFDAGGLAIDPATGDVYVSDNNYAAGATEANAGWLALDSGVTAVLDQNTDPLDDVFGSFDDRAEGLLLFNGAIYKAGFTNSPDFNFPAPGSPAFGGTPEGQYDGIFISYNYVG